MNYSSRKYKRLVQWIALNDNDGEDEEPKELAGYLTVTMIAHCFDLRNAQVAEDVYKLRHP
jgi:hypothetical protein